ncbi:MAG: glycosyltransferase [Patescibacteria group bacterium]
MKICYINNLYQPYAVGGAEKVIENLVKFGDVVISWKPWTCWSSWRPERSVEDGVIIYRYWAPNIFSYKNLAKHNFLLKLLWHKIDIWNFWSARIIKKILIKEKPDAVNTHNLMGIGFGVPKVIQRLGLKHIHTLHDVQLVEPSGVLPWNHTRDSLAQKIYSWIMKRRFGRPDEIAALSGFIEKFYRERGFFVNSNWKMENRNIEIRNKEIRNKEIRNSELVNRSAGLRVRKFLFVSSLVKHKGIEVLMRAWEGLPNDFKGEFHIVGDGALRKEVEAWGRKDERVKIYGRLGKEELNKVYEKCDVLVFPSMCIENRPQVIVEAMQYGLFIIASDTGGVGELLSGYAKARLVEPGSLDFRTCLEKYYSG